MTESAGKVHSLFTKDVILDKERHSKRKNNLFIYFFQQKSFSNKK
jgi:hypothetical protein